jgi:feruloyl esterase
MSLNSSASSIFEFDKAALSAVSEMVDLNANSTKNTRFRVAFGADFDAEAEELDAYFRLFRVPGMFHCNSGPGAWVLGQQGAAAAAGIEFVPQRNVLAALVAWVEEGEVPETIGGVKFVNDTVGQGVAMERRHCRLVSHPILHDCD